MAAPMTRRRPSQPSLRPSSLDTHIGFAESILDSLGSANPWMSFFPMAKYFRAMGAIYSIWVLFLIYENWSFARLSAPWIWASIFSAPFTHITIFAFVSPLPWILARGLRSPWHFVGGLALALIMCEVSASILPIIDGWFFVRAKVPFEPRRLFLLYVALVGPVMIVVGGLVASRALSEERRLASEAEALVAKNRLLQSQIHPHVLFNALNGLAELIHKNPADAETAVRHLSDLLRRIMQASEHALLPLKEERQIISDFLALEGIRLGKRLRVSWAWDDALDRVELPPLLLQPLVENAIKHGIAPSIPGGDIQIRTRISDGILYLEVWNSGAPFAEVGRPGGLGVRNLRSRLALHFDSEAELWIGSSESGTLASIRLLAKQVDYSDEAPENLGC